MNKCDEFPVRHINSKDIPVWDAGVVLPPSAQLLMFVTERDQSCGQSLPFIYKLPTSQVLPSGQANPWTITLPGNGASIILPEGEVRAGYVFNNQPHDIRLANDNEALAKFMIVGTDTDNTGSYLVQTTGVYSFPGEHKYTVGYNYYLGLNGQPVIEETSQHLFYVLDDRRISINLERLWTTAE